MNRTVEPYSPVWPSLAAVALAFLSSTLPATAEDTPARRTVVAGSYEAGSLRRFFLGGDYRAAWATPVSVEVLDLAKEAGGLTPVRRVGGQQTKGLALTGADGRSYTFRGLEKDASHLLDVIDPELKDSVIAKLLNDQMAAQHPASELVARGILDAVGIPVPGLAARRPARRPRARRVPQGLRGRRRRLRGLPAAGQGSGPRLPGRDRAHRPHGALQAAGGGRGRRRGHAGAAQGAARGHLHGRLGPAPQAVALGQAPGQPAAGCRSPRTATRPSRATRAFVLDLGAGARPALPGLRPEVPEHRRAHLQRLRAGPAPPGGLLARGLRADGEGPAGPAHRRGASRRRFGRCRPSGTRSTARGSSPS